MGPRQDGSYTERCGLRMGGGDGYGQEANGKAGVGPVVGKRQPPNTRASLREEPRNRS